MHSAATKSPSTRIVLSLSVSHNLDPSRISYYAFRFRALWWINANVKSTVRLPPRPMEVSSFSSFIVRVFDEEVPAWVSFRVSDIDFLCSEGRQHSPSRCWVVTSSIEIDPLGYVQIFRLIVTAVVVFSVDRTHHNTCILRTLLREVILNFQLELGWKRLVHRLVPNRQRCIRTSCYL